VRVEPELARVDHLVGEQAEPTTGDHFRIQLLERSGRRVPGIRVRLEALVTSSRVQVVEVGAQHVHLSAHFERSILADAQRQCSDRLEVRGDVVAHAAVAAGGAALEHTVTVAEGHSDPVELELHVVTKRLPGQPFAYATVELPHLALVISIRERPHRNRVRNRVETIERRPADPLRRRVGGPELRESGLQRLQLLHEPVVLVVGDLRSRFHVVEAVMASDLVGKLDAPPALRRAGRLLRLRHSGTPASNTMSPTGMARSAHWRSWIPR
jgi:hypothetical protein